MKRSGFSLIEILVALGVLVLLLVLAYAGFHKARAAGYSTVCLANLREHGIGINRRSIETGNLYPYRLWEEGIGKDTWRQDLARWNWLPWDPSVDGCPAEPIALNNRVNNGHVSHYGAPARGGPAGGYVSIGKIREPSKLVLVADTVPIWYFTDGEDYIAFRHSEKVNLVFLDGHAESRTHDEIPWRVDRGKTEEYRTFWYGVE